MARKKAVEAQAEKQRRQKKIVIGGAVLLVAVLAFQGPRTLSMLNREEPPPPSYEPPGGTQPQPAGEVPLAPPTLANAAAPAAGAAGALTDSDPSPAPAAGQLVSFELFESKDPFEQQIKASTQAPGPTAGPRGGKKTPKQPPTGTTPAVPIGPTPPAAASGTATISVNGVAESVAVGKEFPAKNPIFRLVSASAKSVKIGIVDGSFADGDATVTLRVGETLTLMNTADGTRYDVRLVSLS